MTGQRTFVISAAFAAAAAGIAGYWAYSHPFAARDAAWAAHMRLGGARKVRVAGLEGYVRDTCRPGGDCRCVALVHGLGDTALTWRRLLRDDKEGAVPAGYRLYAFNMPGTKGSVPPASPAGYALRAQAGALGNALEDLCGGAPWTLVGNSLGGWIAAWLTLDQPALVERLILVSAAGLHDPSGATAETGRTLAFPTVQALKSFAGRARHQPTYASDRIWEALVRRIRRSKNIAILKTISDSDFLDDKLAAVLVPTEVVWGASDRVIPLDVGLRYARAIQGASFRKIQACGHQPQAECPTVLRWVVFGRESLRVPALRS